MTTTPSPSSSHTTTVPSTIMHTPHSHSSGAVKINYVVEHAAPSAVCLVRKLQTSPYQPLSTEQLQNVTAPNLLSLRPPPHVAHQAVMDFYFAMNGHCGVQCADPSALDLITVSTHPRSTGSNSHSNSNSNSSTGHHSNADGYVRDSTGIQNSVTRSFYNNAADPAAKKFPTTETSSSTPPMMEGIMYGQQQQQQQCPASSVLGTPILPPTSTSSSEDYRLSQIRRNERHKAADAGRIVISFMLVKAALVAQEGSMNTNASSNNNNSGTGGSIGGAVLSQFP
ncbi:hypothetical protein LSM04_005600 [Trypanosoma melophagium]|uniref:uncharacterized protein n=1 Tax=Trypanosoma melophagium TaxID=715481 RepID=UPI00351A6520|nr:hypothetical protein LSM04_005600 [Trypanosoma melophagium]